jgi:FKBP-type peptidyl-prolyl cis-trans isomerase 2
MIEDDSRISIEYTLTVDGATVDSNVGGEPLSFRLGNHEVLQGLEDSLIGLAVGDQTTVTLDEEEGYGPVDQDLFDTVPTEEIPEEARHVGAELTTETEDGQTVFFTVREVRGDEIAIDMNHPLAGKTLQFEVKILAIE